jgi:hypothetical protein
MRQIAELCWLLWAAKGNWGIKRERGLRKINSYPINYLKYQYFDG